MAGSGVMSFMSANAAKGSSEIQQRSRSESSKTVQSLERQVSQAKQSLEQNAKSASQQAYQISISKAEPVATKPALPGLSPPLREYVRVQNS